MYCSAEVCNTVWVSRFGCPAAAQGLKSLAIILVVPMGLIQSFEVETVLSAFLEHGHLGYATFVATAFKVGIEECVNHGDCLFVRDKAGGDAKDICVVVLAGQLG